MGNHCLKSTCKPKLAISITLNRKSKKIITSNLLLNQIEKIYFYLKQEIWENCYFKSTFKPKQAKIVTLNGKSKKIVTLNHLVSQNWKTLLLWTRNLRKSNFAKLSLKPHTTHPHLSWFTWWYTAGASCCLLILYLVAKYIIRDMDFEEVTLGCRETKQTKKQKQPLMKPSKYLRWYVHNS